MHKRGYSRHAVSVCLSVSVHLSVTFVSSVKTNKHIFEFFSPLDSQAILVFPHQTVWRYSDGNPPNGGVECRWGRLVVLKSGLGLKSGLKSTFAGLGLGLGNFFSKSSDKSTSYKVINRQ